MQRSVSGPVRERRREANLKAFEGCGGELSGVVKVVDVGETAEKVEEEEERRRKGSFRVGRR